MWTETYKGFTLRRWPGARTVEVTYPGCCIPQHFKSLHAAKCRITRYLKNSTE